MLPVAEILVPEPLIPFQEIIPLAPALVAEEVVVPSMPVIPMAEAIVPVEEVIVPMQPVLPVIPQQVEVQQMEPVDVDITVQQYEPHVSMKEE